MPFDMQPRIQNEWIRLEPLEPSDFESLYSVASDPLIWEQHPNKNRYRREIFAVYFKGAIESRGAFRVLDECGELLGSSRYCDWDERERSISIGYTFLARRAWGREYNRALKTLMLDHAFLHADRVLFQVGVANMRSRRAMEKLGAVQVGEAAVSYYGEASNPNAIYAIDKLDWARLKAAHNSAYVKSACNSAEVKVAYEPTEVKVACEPTEVKGAYPPAEAMPPPVKEDLIGQ